MKTYTVVPHILKVTSNAQDIIYFSIGHRLDDYFHTDAKVTLKFEIVDKIIKPPDLRHKFDYYLGEKQNKQLYYSHPFFIPGITFEMLYDNSGNIPSITVNKSYFKYAKHKFENVIPPGLHLMNIAITQLLNKGILTLHCAAFSYTKTSRGCLLFGAPNTGKSFTTYSLVNKGIYFLSEDMTAVDMTHVYSAPFVSSYSEYLPQKDVKYKINDMLKTIPIAGSFMQLKQSNNLLHSLIEQYPYTTKAKLDTLIVLERGSKREIVTLTKKQAYDKIILLNRMEYAHYKDDMLFAYSHFNTDVIQNSLRKEEKLLSKLVSDKKCLVVRAPNHVDYPDLVSKAI